jgi:hypothetical protein
MWYCCWPYIKMAFLRGLCIQTTATHQQSQSNGFIVDVRSSSFTRRSLVHRLLLSARGVKTVPSPCSSRDLHAYCGRESAPLVRHRFPMHNVQRRQGRHSFESTDCSHVCGCRQHTLQRRNINITAPIIIYITSTSTINQSSMPTRSNTLQKQPQTTCNAPTVDNSHRTNPLAHR